MSCHFRGGRFVSNMAFVRLANSTISGPMKPQQIHWHLSSRKLPHGLVWFLQGMVET